MRYRATLVGMLAVTALVQARVRQGDDRPEFWTAIERAVETKGVRSEFDTVLEHMRGIDTRRGRVSGRLARVSSSLAEPWTAPALATELRDALARPLETSDTDPFGNTVSDIASWLDTEDFELPTPDAADDALRQLDEIWSELADKELEGLELLETLSWYVDECHALLETSLEELDDDDRALLFEGHGPFCEAWYRSHFPGAEQTDENKRAFDRFKRLLGKRDVDRRLTLGVAAALMRLADPEFERTLPRRLGKVKEDVDEERFGEDARAVVGEEPQHRVVLTGKRGSTHAFRAALHIDLGGDDTYETAAVVDGPEMLVSVVIDLSGDDTYRAEGTSAGPAYAAGGAALLVDRRGDDRYESARLGQAATALGFAALVDQEGDDVYTGEDYVQGHAAGGVALLYDIAGTDEYTAWAYAHGGGIGPGLSALVDGAGSDRYVADLHWPDVYGDSGPDVHHSASQGYCTGLRPEVAGGIAAFLDLGDGDDRYQGGSFSQGGGYYYSFGLMFDGGGDDENFGSRYSQGFGVHQATGVRWDAAGNDQYTCRSVAHTGMAWDEGVGYLIEDGGDDVYRTGALSCGGAAQTGVAICLESGGKDTYRTGGSSQGGTGSSNYHDKPALGVLLDRGNDTDEYSAKERADGAEVTTAGVGVFVDEGK